MFTGLVEETGVVRSVRTRMDSAVLTIEAGKILEDAKIGDSICTNGVCLTITSMTDRAFTVDVMPVTMGNTNLGKLKAGSRVNLERALRLSDRLGGHMLSGHVDGTGIIASAAEEENAVRVRIQAPGDIMKYIISRGSIAIDGTSLTVAGLGEGWFEVSIIPHTRESTTLIGKRAGEEVNLECDIIGKYVERLLKFKEPEQSKMSMEFLKENGFI